MLTYKGIDLTGYTKMAGWTVIETPNLKFDGLLASHEGQVLLVGEIAHLAYRVRMSEANEMLRQRVQQMSAELAEWAGVDVPLGSK